MKDNNESKKWDTEKDDGEGTHPEEQPDEIMPENINPAISKSQWDKMTFHAIKMYFDSSKTKVEAINKVKGWNANNNPRLNEKSLMKKIIWALENFDHDLE